MSNPYEKNVVGISWSPLEKELLLDLVDKGLGYDAIAACIPTKTRKAIISKIHRLRDVPPPSNPWTHERVMQLKELRASGISAGLIADRMGLSRNAIIGKLHRIGVSAPVRVKAVNGHQVEWRRRRRPYRLRARTNQMEESIPEPPADKSEHPVAFVDLEPHHCRYPVGSETPARWFCGDQVVQGKPYCPRHCRICYPKPQRIDPQERARRALWWDRQTMFTPSGQTVVGPAESTQQCQPSRTG